MTWLPRDTVLGELTLADTFVFYDGPRVFSCRSLTDQTYLAVWAEEGADADLWLYVPVSAARLAMIRSGGMSLREALSTPEGIAYLVRLPHDEDESDEARPISRSDLQDAWLPDEGFRLEIETATLRQADSEDAIVALARQEHRTRLRLRLRLDDELRSEAPARSVGELLVLTQNVYDNLGLAISEPDPPQTGRIPARISLEVESSVLETRAASFVVELGASKSDDLFGSSLFTQVTQRLLSLLDVSVDFDSLASDVRSLRPRGAKSFRKFVAGLADTGGDVTVAAAGVSFAYTRRVLSRDTLQNLVLILNRLVPDEEVEQIRGRMRLYRGDTQRRVFGLQDEAADLSYEGKVSDRAFNQVAHAELGASYDVVIVATSVLDEVVGERRVRYELDQLAPISDLQ